MISFLVQFLIYTSYCILSCFSLLRWRISSKSLFSYGILGVKFLGPRLSTVLVCPCICLIKWLDIEFLVQNKSPSEPHLFLVIEIDAKNWFQFPCKIACLFCLELFKMFSLYFRCSDEVWAFTHSSISISVGQPQDSYEMLFYYFLFFNFFCYVSF